jgi:site-specific recombinase XerD
MPYGFIKHIEHRGYSVVTVKSYENVLDQFFKYLKAVYPENKEPFQISPADIKNYLTSQQEKGKNISTINKELAIIKTLFHYLWERDKIPVDPTVKIKRFKAEKESIIEVSYIEILAILEKVLKNQGYSKLRKAIFLLAVKGLKTSDFHFTKDDVADSLEEDKVVIKLKNRSITLNVLEATYFQDYYYEAEINGSNYVFTTKKHGEKYGGPIEVMSILNHLRAISEDYLRGDLRTLTLISIRRALAFHLYSENTPIQSIAKDLGIEENSASNYLKNLTKNF